jgi:hypothetical protein
VAIVGSTQEVHGQEVTILVEVDDPPGGETLDGYTMDGDWGETRSTRADKVMDAARDVFGDGLALARDCAARAVDSIEHTASDVRPDQFEISLAIKLDAQAGAVLAKVGAGAQLQVTMRWSRQEAA